MLVTFSSSAESVLHTLRLGDRTYAWPLIMLIVMLEAEVDSFLIFFEFCGFDRCVFLFLFFFFFFFFFFLNK